jgi:hypothetical protein
MQRPCKRRLIIAPRRRRAISARPADHKYDFAAINQAAADAAFGATIMLKLPSH